MSNHQVPKNYLQVFFLVMESSNEKFPFMPQYRFINNLLEVIT